ncbi:MAG: trypsin-like peptidase domain-containing protein [Xanthomonadales bacterium]|nr:trypsin-like peptidase domain-containing protein [Xanthomonadales bacterium]
MNAAASWIKYLFQAIVAGLALAFLVVYLFPSLATRVTPAPATTAVAAPSSYAEAVNRTAPAVVSIYTRTLAPQEVSPEMQRMLGNRQLFRMRADMGSGVLVNEDGYILTNHHVVSGVSNVRVALWDGRIASARLVGSDPESDLAVLKISVTGLPVAPIAESPRVQVGDVVLAIGNALGLSHTVTMGIVSATGRNDLGSLRYQDFIQTDAAINAGNSGGALVNAHGEVIGINTRSLGASTGGQNIGFAIPISLARSVMQQIIDYGSVRRGWLGALFSDLPLSAQADGSTARRGIQVRDVSPDGPAWNAGIRPGDILLSIDGRPADDARALLLEVAQMEPGAVVELEVQREDGLFQTYATLIQQPPLR